MKFQNVLLLAVLAIATLSFTLVETAGYEVDTEASNLKWTGYKVTGKHFGNLTLKRGALNVEDGKLVGGSFDIDMSSITVTDISGGGAKKLEGHLKSADFFGTNEHPTATLKITKAIPYGTSGAYKIVADLTIKKITKSIKFKANVDMSDNQVSANAKITVDRSDFNVRYGSGSFFDNLGDKTIYDEFDIEVKLVANK